MTVTAAALSLAGCGATARLPISAGIGPELSSRGFVNEDGEAFGRPVGVAVDTHGSLLVVDDVGNVIWRVAAGSPRR